MGSILLNCMVTGLEIGYDELMVVMLYEKSPTRYVNKGVYLDDVNHLVRASYLPVFGTIDGEGSISRVKKDENVALIEKRTGIPINKLLYLFRRGEYYGQGLSQFHAEYMREDVFTMYDNYDVNMREFLMITGFSVVENAEKLEATHPCCSFTVIFEDKTRLKDGYVIRYADGNEKELFNTRRVNFMTTAIETDGYYIGANEDRVDELKIVNNMVLGFVNQRVFDMFVSEGQGTVDYQVASIYDDVRDQFASDILNLSKFEDSLYRTNRMNFMSKIQSEWNVDERVKTRLGLSRVIKNEIEILKG